MIIGISGCTNGGKSSLSKLILNEFKNIVYINQDQFFYPKESGKLEYRAELNSFNYDCLEAVDSGKFLSFVNEIIQKTPKDHIILIDGFLIFKYLNLNFDLKLFFTLTKEECCLRRSKRNYKTVGTHEYFETLVWPCYENYYECCQKQFNDIIYIDGINDMQNTFNLVKNKILTFQNF